MAKKFTELRSKMTPEAQARAAARAEKTSEGEFEGENNSLSSFFNLFSKGPVPIIKKRSGLLDRDPENINPKGSDKD